MRMRIFNFEFRINQIVFVPPVRGVGGCEPSGTKNRIPFYNRGFVTLIAVLIAGAAALTITLSMLVIGVTSGKNSLVVSQSLQARNLAVACAEEALEQINLSGDYLGSSNLQLAGGSCGYAITSQGGENRTINSQGLIDMVVRKNKVILDAVSPTPRVVSWQEVAD